MKTWANRVIAWHLMDRLLDMRHDAKYQHCRLTVEEAINLVIVRELGVFRQESTFDGSMC